MKKILLFLIAIVVHLNVFGQFIGYVLDGESMQEENSVPGSANAAIVKSATIDLPNNTSLVGIVWSNNNNDGYLYVADHNNVTVLPAAVALPISAPPSISLDPGYLIGNVDIAMIPYVDPTLGSTVYGALIKVMYQRRLLPTATWEVVVKTFVSNSLTGITNMTQMGSTWSLGTGKHVAIDAFVHVDKLMPNLSDATFDYFTIGWGTVNGYEVRVIDVMDNVYNANLLPYTFTANHMRNDSVAHIDLACVRQVGIQPNGVIQDDRVYIVVRDACSHNTHCESHIWEWTVDYAMGSAGSLVPIDTIHGASLSGRFRIEAMSIQNDALNETKYNVLVCLDGTVVFCYSRTGTTNYDTYGLPYDFNINTTPPLAISGPGETFDITAGIGFYGNQNYVANRHYPIIREADWADIIYVSGVERSAYALSYPLSPTSVKIEELSRLPLSSGASPFGVGKITNYNDGMSTWGYPGLNNPKIFDNISVSTSTNNGKCILNTWTNFAGLFGNSIYYKIKQSEDDLTDPSPGVPPSTHWNATNLHPQTDAALNIYPNPASSTLSIQHTESIIKHVVLYNMEGKAMHIPIDIHEHRAILQIAALPVGTYQVHVSLDNGQTLTKNILKQ